MISLRLWISIFLFLLAGCGGITGQAIDTINAQVVVQNVEIDTKSFSQNITPVTFGDSVRIGIALKYYGTGTEPITVEIPTNFTNGNSWYVIEDGRSRNITQTGSSLSWTANMSVANATIYFTVPAPELSTQSIEQSNTRYTKTVIVTAPNSFREVSASTSVDNQYDSYVLLEEGVDVSQAYNFVVSDSVAQWSGFHLSNRTFSIRGFKEEIVSSGGRNSCYDCEVLCFDGTYEARLEYCPERENNSIARENIAQKPVQISHESLLFELGQEDHEFTIDIINGFDRMRNYTVETSILQPQMLQFSLERGERTTITYTVPHISGEWEDLITIRALDVDEEIEVTVIRPEKPIEPQVEEPAAPNSWPLKTTLTLIIVLLGFWLWKRKR